MRPKMIISGGQTGADQGGLLGAKRCGIKTGGMAPKGYRTESGKNPTLLRDHYGLSESPYWQYPPRTRDNARASGGTVWFGNTGSPGYRCTYNAVKATRRLWLENPTPDVLAKWVGDNGIEILNVAGNRESTNPGICQRTCYTIVEAFK